MAEYRSPSGRVMNLPAHMVPPRIKAGYPPLRPSVTTPLTVEPTKFYVEPASSETEFLAELSTKAPRIPWDQFLSHHFTWGAGEHIGMVGPTGQGKTTLLLQILELHRYVTVFATKPRDSSMDWLTVRHGESAYYKMERWRALNPDNYPRRVLWPDASSVHSEKKQAEVFRHAFDSIYREGFWTVAIDELWYICKILGLDREIKVFLLQARSLGISLVCATQRPAWVPLEVYDQSSHLFFWRDNDETNLKRIAGLNGGNAALVRKILPSLDKHHVLYVDNRTGAMVRTKPPKLEGV